MKAIYSEVEPLTSIFTIKRRKNFKESYDKFISDLQTVVETTTGKKYKMIDYLDYCIRYWPYRCDAISIDDYLSGMVTDTAINQEQRQLLLALENCILIFCIGRQSRILLMIEIVILEYPLKRMMLRKKLNVSWII